MNCKPGDLAVVVRSSAGNEGKCVRCVRLFPAIEFLSRENILVVRSNVWEIDTALPSWDGGTTAYVPDAWLRPIRDPGDDAVDEVLQRIPSPFKIKETA